MRSMRRFTRCSTRAHASHSRSASPSHRVEAVDFYRPEREAQVLRKALARNRGPLRDEEIVRLFREIMSACLAQEEPLKVAFLGPEGTFTQAAVLKHFGHSVRALRAADGRRGVSGGRSRQCRLRSRAPSRTRARAPSPTRWIASWISAAHLRRGGAAHPPLPDGHDGALCEGIVRVCSHGQALGQCRGWLDEHLPDVERVASPAMPRARARARRAGHRGDRRESGRRGLWAEAARARDRGPAGQRHALSGPGPQAPQAERRGSHHAVALGDRYADAGALFRLLEPLASMASA